MYKKVLLILFLIILFAFTVFLSVKSNVTYKIIKIISASEFVLDNDENIKVQSVQAFYPNYSTVNHKLAQMMKISDDEAFILGVMGKYYAENFLYNKKVKIKNGDIITNGLNYRINYENSPYCVKDEKACNETAFKKELEKIRKYKYVILDLDKDIYYPITKENYEKIEHPVVVRQSHLIKSMVKEYDMMQDLVKIKFKNPILSVGKIKIILSDHTSNLKPNRNCTDNVCKELVSNINNAQTSIDLAIYGYSSVPAVEKALVRALNRGVKIRLVYDINSKGKNPYPDTYKLIKLIKNSVSDKNSKNSSYIMHNKFYIFDNKIVITGSANLSENDMSGFNSNSIIVINSEKIADLYTQEFNQMFNGKFHNEKSLIQDKSEKDLTVYFSPKDKIITKAIIPAIKNAEKYIYIPAFIISDKRVINELINAKKRGVDVKIIIDAVFVSNKISKHEKLRQAGIPLKIENYAGKLHSKTIVIDDKYLIMGSMNFSEAGENKNDENMIFINNSKIAVFYREFFQYLWKKIPDKWLKYNPGAEGVNSYGSCSDRVDNNYNDLVDMDDPACKTKQLSFN